jgi:5'-nucleotidase
MSRSNIRTMLTALPLSSILMACGAQHAAPSETTATQTEALKQGGSDGHDDHNGAGDCSRHAERNDPAERDDAERVVKWQGNKKPGKKGTLGLKVLGFNDFHGHLAEGSKVGARPVGGAAVLASYLRAAQVGYEDRNLIIHAGDQVGASPAESALLQDEPSIQFLNLLANDACKCKHDREECNVIGTLGNHEFDEGKDELLRLLNGGNYANGPFLQNPYPGASFPYVNSNVVVERTGKNLIAPSVVREIANVKVGIIGAVLKETPTIVTPAGVAGLSFRDEAQSINAAVRKIKHEGVSTVIVTIHQGTAQSPTYTGSTDAGAAVGTPISTIVSQLDDEVDLVISGHSHSFTNALVPNASGHPILVVQAFSYGTAYDDVDLVIDRATGDVVAKSAKVVTTYSDVAPGDTRAVDVQALVDEAVARVAPLVNQQIATVVSDITRTQNTAGESALGNLIADAQRAATGTDFAFMNPGGIRADITYAANPSNPLDTAGAVLWGELFTVQPFGNTLVTINMTGQQIVDVLNQQWTVNRILQISGLTYTWDNAQPVGSKVVEVRRNAEPINLAATYTVTVNNFLVGGGDGFTVFKLGTNQAGGDVDLDALIKYMQLQPQPIAAPALTRITQLN